MSSFPQFELHGDTWNELPDEIDFPDYSSDIEDYAESHSVYTIQLQELIDMKFYKPQSEDWKFKVEVYQKRDNQGYIILGEDGYPTYDEKRNEELYQRLVYKFQKKFAWREICTTPPSKWKVMYLDVFKRAVDDAAQYYRFNDELNKGTRGHNWSKRRIINSDFPATAIQNQIEDYASDGSLSEWESLNRNARLQDVINAYDKWRNPDDEVMKKLEPLFFGLYTSNVNGL